MEIKKIISGGQSGADLAGNTFARKYGIETEINAFRDFKPSYDEIPNDIKINYVCDKGNYSSNLRCRTSFNVKEADFTIILLGQPIEYTKGSKLTYKECVRHKKSSLFIDVNTLKGQYIYSDEPFLGASGCIESVGDAVHVLNVKNPKILNVAGERNLNKKICIELLEKMFVERIRG